jgi:hypothetical protein
MICVFTSWWMTDLERLCLSVVGKPLNKLNKNLESKSKATRFFFGFNVLKTTSHTVAIEGYQVVNKFNENFKFN